MKPLKSVSFKAEIVSSKGFHRRSPKAKHIGYIPPRIYASGSVARIAICHTR